ncbi:hypothetical protein OAE61_03880 [Verrucomicrobiales bacterium]|nr:hypothetical protein [Verrucomicrobiales bacterium]
MNLFEPAKAFPEQVFNFIFIQLGKLVTNSGTRHPKGILKQMKSVFKALRDGLLPSTKHTVSVN